jgi:hypothetical protein
MIEQMNIQWYVSNFIIEYMDIKKINTEKWINN